MLTFGPTLRLHAASDLLVISILKTMGVPTEYESLSISTVTAMSSGAQSELAVVVEELGDPLPLGVTVAPAVGDAGAPVGAEPPVHDLKSTSRRISRTKTASPTNKRRRQYTDGGSGPRGFITLLTVANANKRLQTLWHRRGMSPSLTMCRSRDGDEATPLVAAVLTWFHANARDLPWRATDASAWGILVSEVMLQQTPVARVLPIWQLWMQRWPTPTDLARASPADVIRSWQRLGYPRRALRLRETAIAIRDTHGGEVPRSRTQLLQLPGIGDYTAAAVLSFAYGHREVVLDTNVRRVLGRSYSGVPKPVSASPTKLERELAASIAPTRPELAKSWAAASMELGALICRARAPICGQCPIADSCAWRAAGFPADTKAASRTQRFEGTDRQVRGRLLAKLRESPRPLPRPILATTWPDDIQRERALDSLIADGLVEPLAADRYRLPQ